MDAGILDLARLYDFIRKNKEVPHRTNDKDIYRPFKAIFHELIKNVPLKTGWYHWVEITEEFRSKYIGKSDSNTTYNLYKRIEEELSEEYVALWSTVYDANIVLNTFNEKYGYKEYNKCRHERAMKKKGTTHIIWISVDINLNKEKIKYIEHRLINHFHPEANIQSYNLHSTDSKLFEAVKNKFESLIINIRGPNKVIF